MNVHMRACEHAHTQNGHDDLKCNSFHEESEFSSLHSSHILAKVSEHWGITKCDRNCLDFPQAQ